MTNPRETAGLSCALAERVGGWADWGEKTKPAHAWLRGPGGLWRGLKGRKGLGYGMRERGVTMPRGTPSLAQPPPRKRS